MNDVDELNKALKELIEVFQKKKLTVQDILIVYGNLGYALGASIEGYKEGGPGIEELKEKYANSQSIGVALMLQGILVTSWCEGLKEGEESNKNDDGEEK